MSLPSTRSPYFSVLELMQDLLAPGALNFYSINDYITAALAVVGHKNYVFSGLMSEEQVSSLLYQGCSVSCPTEAGCALLVHLTCTSMHMVQIAHCCAVSTLWGVVVSMDQSVLATVLLQLYSV